MAPSKYADFEEGCVVTHKSTKPPYDEHRYIPITCPHCKVVFIDIKETDLRTNKASKCLTHLRACEAYKGTGVEIVLRKHPVTNELAELKAEMAVMKQINADTNEKLESQHKKLESQQQEIKVLQDKTGLYDGVLAAVMPSLALPLTAPEEYAKITLREAAIKDITMPPLALPAPKDMVSREMHVEMVEQKNEMIEQKNEMIATEKAHREEIANMYKMQLDVKDSELINANFEKEIANQRAKEAEQRAKEASQTATSMTSRAEKLQKDRDALFAKYNAAIKGHEQRWGKLQQGQKQRMAAMTSMDAETAVAVAIEKEFAAKRNDMEATRAAAVACEREFAQKESALKRARHS